METLHDKEDSQSQIFSTTTTTRVISVSLVVPHLVAENLPLVRKYPTGGYITSGRWFNFRYVAEVCAHSTRESGAIDFRPEMPRACSEVT
jgi:hypothetical protein